MCTTYYYTFSGCGHDWIDPNMSIRPCADKILQYRSQDACAAMEHRQKSKIHGACPPCSRKEAGSLDGKKQAAGLGHKEIDDETETNLHLAIEKELGRAEKSRL
jgi:hypothetical protein